MDGIVLQAQYLDDAEPWKVVVAPGSADVAALLDEIDWERFAFLTLKQDDDNWLDGSGSLDPDCGLSMMLSIDGIQFVTRTAPPTPISMLDAFNAYLSGDLDRLFDLIYDAEARGLTREEVSRLRRREVEDQSEHGD